MRGIFLKYMMMLVLFVGGLAGCDKLEDTYSDYTGDGPERYLTKIYDLRGNAKWLSVLLTWDLKLDPGRTAILVEWKDDEKTDSVIIDKESKSFLVEGLKNYEYEFTVCAIEQKEGKIEKRSLGDPVYVRPYSFESEELALFSRVVNKPFNVAGKHLFVTFDAWADNLISFKIGYFEKGNNTEQFWEITPEDRVGNWPKGKPYALIGNDIDFSKPVKVYRRGRIASVDNMMLDLNPIDLYFDVPTFESDFAAEVRNKLDLVGEIKRGDIENVETLNIDYNQVSLADVLHFPNLKELYLGRNRYIASGTEDQTKSTLSNPEVTIGALKVIAEELGVKIYHYGKHYFEVVPDFFTTKNERSEVPSSLALLDVTGWQMSVSPEDQDYNSGLQNLLDQEKHYWSPQASQKTMREHIVMIDMGGVQPIQGFLIMQAEDITIPSGKTGSKPESLKIELLNEFGQWETATFQESANLGTGTHEKTIVYLDKNKSTKKASKVRFMIYDRGFKASWAIDFSDYKVALSTFMVIRGN